MEIFEEEIKNSKVILLDWLYDEIFLQNPDLRDELNEKGQKLPLNH